MLNPLIEEKGTGKIEKDNEEMSKHNCTNLVV